MRKKWLDRLFEAIQEDDPPYIEHLGDHWGDLCATPELASRWADQLLPTQRSVLRERKGGTYVFVSGTTLCYSALFKAGRHDELLELLAMDSRPIWPYLVWGARVLAARGQVDEAIAYARDRAGSTSLETIARFAEDALLKAGRRAEAFDQFALLANQGNSNLSTFRALAKKYPQLAPDKLLSHLIDSTPREPGKWFATAKTWGAGPVSGAAAIAGHAVQMGPGDRADREHRGGRSEHGKQVRHHRSAAVACDEALFRAGVAQVIEEENPTTAEKLKRASPHWMRHTHATHALAHGAELTTVRDNLRHASIQTTSIYLHVDEVKRARQMEGAFHSVKPSP